MCNSEEYSRNQSGSTKAALVILVFILGVGIGGGMWYYRAHRVQTASPAISTPQSASTVAAMAVETPRTPAAVARTESPSPNEAQNKQPEVEITAQPMEQFREDLKKELAQQLGPANPQLPDLGREAGNTVDATYRGSVFQFLDSAENASAGQKPSMLLAADFMLQALWCPSEQKENCDPIRKQFADHKLTLALSELGGGWYYQHDLLWRVWQDFPTTEWGERAFVLLLDAGWDTSGMCAKIGSDQFREVIRQGESFLQQHPNSVHRPVVIHLVAQAYSTWWSLSTPPKAELADYVDPKLYKNGAEAARLKAIDLFEEVLRLSPGSALGEYSRQALPSLRAQQLTSNAYRFFCIYD